LEIFIVKNEKLKIINQILLNELNKKENTKGFFPLKEEFIDLIKIYLEFEIEVDFLLKEESENKKYFIFNLGY
jgi:hypothetical protein